MRIRKLTLLIIVVLMTHQHHGTACMHTLVSLPHLLVRQSGSFLTKLRISDIAYPYACNRTTNQAESNLHALKHMIL